MKWQAAQQTAFDVLREGLCSEPILLAVVWAVDKLVKYLYGAVFVLQTDHESLKYLQRAKFDNQRVMRWSLLLQPYRYRVEYIKGCDNLAADFLSRSVE